MLKLLVRFVPALIILAFGIRPCSCQDRPSIQSRNERFAALVEQLASPNKPPKITRSKDVEETVRLGADYDKGAQKAVDKARRELLEGGREAFPYLVEALNDDRYCMTVLIAEEYYRNRTVGEICRELLAAQSEVYRPKVSFSSAPHWRRYNYPITKEWWHSRQKRSLVDLQVEAIDWAIAKRMEDDIWVEEREPAIQEMKKLKDELTKSGKPAPAERLLRMVLNDH